MFKKFDEILERSDDDMSILSSGKTQIGGINWRYTILGHDGIFGSHLVFNFIVEKSDDLDAHSNPKYADLIIKRIERAVGPGVSVEQKRETYFAGFEFNASLKDIANNIRKKL